MSEKPLFQNSDEQEGVYAPQQLPEGSVGERSAAVEGDSGGDIDAPDAALLPGAFAGGANMGGLGPSVGTTGTASGIAPAAGAAGLADAFDDNDAAPGSE